MQRVPLLHCQQRGCRHWVCVLHLPRPGHRTRRARTRDIPRLSGPARRADQQLALCQRLLTKPPAPGHHVVWVAFDRAGPGNADLEVGPVSLWSCEWVQAVLDQGGPECSAHPGGARGYRRVNRDALSAGDADSMPDVRYRGLPGALSLTRPRAARLAGWPHG
jgi:hypothetical protein